MEKIPGKEAQSESNSNPEVTAESSKENLEKGYEAVKLLIEGLSGKCIGTTYQEGRYGSLRGEVLLFSEVGEERALEVLFTKRHWRLLYDDELVASGDEGGLGDTYESDFKYFLGGRPICSELIHQQTDNRSDEFLVFGKPVSGADYGAFERRVKEMSNQKREEFGGYATFRELSPELKMKVEQVEGAHLLGVGTVVQPGEIRLHDIYGSSYFGSGGGFGSVKAFDLSAFRHGERIDKEIKTKNGDNGFVSGPNRVLIEPNTIVVCRGGDSIGGGREWEEVYICE